MAQEKNQKTESALLSKVWNIANVLSAAGVSFTDYITQLTYILFLKMDDEKEALGLGSYLPEGSKWKDLRAFSGDDLEPVHTKASIIMANRMKPAKTTSSLS